MSGGAYNTASGANGSVGGGYSNAVTDDFGAISGGCNNLTGTGTNPFAFGHCGTSFSAPTYDSITGGMNNISDGVATVVSAGNNNTASGAWGAWVGGGWNNTSSGSSTSMVGGAGRTLGGSGTDNESQVGPTLFAG